MAHSPLFKIYSKDHGYVAACKFASDAAGGIMLDRVRQMHEASLARVKAYQPSQAA